MTIFHEFQRQFPDDEACLRHIMETRYGAEIDCPKCGVHGKFHRMTRERGYVGAYCGHHIYPCAGTFMHRTRLPLHKWFFAMSMFATTRHGVAARELQRQLGVSYPTAWRMGQLIRRSMAETDGEWPLGSVVAVDETLIGGKVEGKGRGYRENKTTVSA